MNSKDGPFAVAMLVLLAGLVRVFEAFPHPSVASTALLGIGLGLSIGSRVMAGFGILSAAGGLALVFAVDARREGWYSAGARMLRFSAKLLPALALGYALMGLVWPWAVIDPINPFRAVVYFSHFFEMPWHELFAGQVLEPPDMPRSYVPTLFALKLPELFLLAGFGGGVGALVGAFRSDVPRNRRAVIFTLVLLAILPLAAAVVLRPAMYNGIRHFVFVLPPLAVLGGLAIARLLGKTAPPAQAALAIVLAIGIGSPVFEMIRLHPYEYTHFNHFAGGVRGAHGRYMIDYWGLSFKQASQQLIRQIAGLGYRHPRDRHWKIALCGPNRSPQVELGPDFDLTSDPKGADFAMTLGEFYCRHLDAPLLTTIERDNVEYARVYDIRGRSYDTLLTVVPSFSPPPPF
jgi:hypothetical protein